MRSRKKFTTNRTKVWTKRHCKSTPIWIYFRRTATKSASLVDIMEKMLLQNNSALPVSYDSFIRMISTSTAKKSTTLSLWYRRISKKLQMLQSHFRISKNFWAIWKQASLKPAVESSPSQKRCNSSRKLSCSMSPARKASLILKPTKELAENFDVNKLESFLGTKG